MKYLLATLWLTISLPPASAEVIAKGSEYSGVRKALTKAKFPNTVLEMEAAGANNQLDFWAVDDGVLIISYSAVTGLVEAISFTLMDERPKASRKVFDFKVASFDTETGKLILETRKPK